MPSGYGSRRGSEYGFDLIAGLILLFILPRNGRQRLLAIPFALLVAFVLRRTYALSCVIGGL